MIAYAGMSDRLPNICYYNNQDYQFQRPYSDETAKIIDDEVLKMINQQYERAKQILREHREGHQALAEMLIRSEVVFAEDVEKIFGKRPWVSRSQEILNEEMKEQQQSSGGQTTTDEQTQAADAKPDVEQQNKPAETTSDTEEKQ